jgi:hypothetical protein
MEQRERWRYIPTSSLALPIFSGECISPKSNRRGFGSRIYIYQEAGQRPNERVNRISGFAPAFVEILHFYYNARFLGLLKLYAFPRKTI